MPDKKGNLYLFEAIELRNEYDTHIKLLENLLCEADNGNDRYYRGDECEEKEASKDFDQKEVEESLKKLKTKRIKLNHEIQKKNFNIQIDYNNGNISVAEALEVRKNFIDELKIISQKIIKSAYKKIIHKEERDIERKTKYNYKDVYQDFKKKIKDKRNLINEIHKANHKYTINFKDE